LKLLIPRYDEVAVNEIKVLRLADGHGCARLYRDDSSRFAMLLERLGRSLFDLQLPMAWRHEILADTAMAVWRPAPDAGLPTGAQKGRWLIDYILALWDEIDRPCSRRAVDYAIACAERRIAAHDDERSVLVHGDVHQWNTLEATPPATVGAPPAAAFKLVDPDGLLADAEYDLGILLREDPVELMQRDPMERAHWLAARTGRDATAIWEWGAVERVSTGLLCTKLDMQPGGRDMLAAAELAAGVP
jgi:streptomycin 6-kinase